jgi:RsiW-degrading membrane proteinase PrsW (M82 family)
MMYVAFILWLDRYEHEPAPLLFFAFFWGAVVAIVFSYVFNSLVTAGFATIVGDSAAGAAESFLGAPPIEEGFKAVALFVLVLLFRDEFDNTLDGIVYGSIVGIGFAMTENIVYFGRQYAEGGITDLALIVVLRAVLGGFGHALFTGTTGAAVGYARETQNNFLKVIMPLVGYCLAIALHSAWNLFAGTIIPSLIPPETGDWFYFCLVAPIQSVVLLGPGLIALGLIVWVAWAREAKIIRQQLLPEVEAGLIPVEDYKIMSSSRLRVRSLWKAFTKHGLVAFLIQRQYIQLATELAFRKWHLERGERTKRAQKVTPEERYRNRIRELQARLAT